MNLNKCLIFFSKPALLRLVLQAPQLIYFNFRFLLSLQTDFRIFFIKPLFWTFFPSHSCFLWKSFVSVLIWQILFLIILDDMIYAINGPTSPNLPVQGFTIEPLSGRIIHRWEPTSDVRLFSKLKGLFTGSKRSVTVLDAQLSDIHSPYVFLV